MLVGFTAVVPDAVEVENAPGVMAIFVTVPVAFHESVEVPAEATTEGDAEKEEMFGAEPLLTVTVIDAVEVLFEVS